MTLFRRHPELPPSLAAALCREHVNVFNGGNILKSSSHREVRECEFDGTSFFIKRYRTTSPLETLRLLGRDSRADRSFSIAHTLERQGVPVPRHLLVAKHVSLAGSTAFLVMEKSEGTPLIQFLQDGTSGQLPVVVESNVIHIVRQLRECGVTHGDLHTRNLIVDEDGAVSLIDLDNASCSRRRQHKDTARLLRALELYPNSWHELVAILR